MRLEVSLINILNDIDSIEWDLDVYISTTSEIIHSSPSLIINDELEEDRDANDEPLYPTQKGYKYFLSIADIQDIKTNLNDRNLNMDMFLKAVIYYYNNDSFMSNNL